MGDLIIPQLIVGLGNPEPKYDHTRHNIGFEAIDNLAHSWGATLKENKRFHGLFSEIGKNGAKMFLLKPTTYMNRSGQAVKAVLDWYKIPPESILVIYDDMDLPVGKIRLRLSGSAGGHNGMKSLISHVNSQNFSRLRIGIGKSNPDKDTISHVLGKFAPDEQKIIKEVLILTEDAINYSIKQGLEKTMSLYNSKSVNN